MIKEKNPFNTVFNWQNEQFNDIMAVIVVRQDCHKFFACIF